MSGAGTSSTGSKPAQVASATTNSNPTRTGLSTKVKIAGQSLVPNLDDHRSEIERSYFYWVGVLPDCPVGSITLAGENFPKLNENIIKGPDGRSRRVPVIGALTKLNAAKVRLLRDRLPTAVIRFTDDKGERDEPGTGLNVGDLHRQPRKGFVIRIPSAAELEERRKAGLAAIPYEQAPGDQPAAKFMFCVLCQNQERGERLDHYPDPVSVTGIEFPDPLD